MPRLSQSQISYYRNKGFEKSIQDMRKKGWGNSSIYPAIAEAFYHGDQSQAKSAVSDYISSGQAPGVFAGSGTTNTGTGGTGGTGPVGENDTGPVAQPGNTSFYDQWLGTGINRAGLDNSPERAAVDLQYQALEQALAGRKAGVQQLMAQRAQFEQDPYMAALQQQIGGLAETPLLSQQDVSGMLSQSSGTIANSYLNNAAGLRSALAGRNISPDSGVSQELGAALRFGALQQDASQAINLKTAAKQMNRQALVQALGLGQSFQGFKQGVSSQLTANIANLLGGENLASAWNQAGGATAALGAPSSAASNPFASILSGAAAGGAAFGVPGAIGGGILGLIGS